MSERDDAREILRELLHEALAVPNGNGGPSRRRGAAGPRAAGRGGAAAVDLDPAGRPAAR